MYFRKFFSPNVESSGELRDQLRFFVLFQVICAEEEHGCPKDDLERAHSDGVWTQ